MGEHKTMIFLFVCVLFSTSAANLIGEFVTNSEEDSTFSTKLAVSPYDGHIYSNSAVGETRRINSNGEVTLVATLPSLFEENGFTLGIDFDHHGNMYIANGRGVFRFSCESLWGDSLPVSHEDAELILPVLKEGSIYHGVAFDGRNSIYVSETVFGDIYKVDTRFTGNYVLWARGVNAGAVVPEPSDNLLGLKFMLADIAMAHHGNFLFICAHSDKKVQRIQIMDGGHPKKDHYGRVVVETIFKAGHDSPNGITVDKAHDRIYFVSPFLDFENGILAEPNLQTAGSLYSMSLSGACKEHPAPQTRHLTNLSSTLGNLGDVVRGTNFGHGGFSETLFTSDSSADTMPFWPNMNGQTSPFPDVEFHSAIRTVQLDRCISANYESGESGENGY